MSPDYSGNADCQFIYLTLPSADEARGIGTMVVKERLAACANILGPVESVYWWKGAMQNSTEVGMILKTTEEKVDRLIERVVALHTYACPCVVALPIESGHGPFLRWVREEVTEE